MSKQRFMASNLEATIVGQGRTKRWVAERAGFTEGMLGHVIARRRSIGKEPAERIAMALGVPFFVLFDSAEAYKMDAMATNRSAA